MAPPKPLDLGPCNPIRASLYHHCVDWHDRGWSTQRSPRLFSRLCKCLALQPPCMCSTFPFLFSFTGFSFVQDLDAIRHELEGEIAYGLDYGLEEEPTDADVFEALEADDESSEEAS